MGDHQRIKKDPITPTKLKKFGKTLKIKQTMKLSPPIDNGTFDALLRIKIISAKELKGVNRNGTSDPFVILRINENKDSEQRTAIKKKTNNPVWNETVEFRVSADEIAKGCLHLTVKDRDKWTKNREIGTLKFEIKDIMQNSDDVINKDYKLHNTMTGSIKIEMQLLSIYRTSELEKKSTFGGPAK